MPVWFSILYPLENEQEEKRKERDKKAHYRALAYGFYSLIVLLIYIFTVI